jgi:transcriptional antiterminator NusG
MSEEKKWYVMRVISGKERKTKEYIDGEINRSKWNEIISQILVPMEKIYKIKDGKKVIKERNFFPGYILMEADENRMTGEMLQKIRNITNVINFLGPANHPQALRKSEVNRILGKVDEMSGVTETHAEPYLVGETVKIVDGPFNDFNGLVEEVNEDKKKLKVTVKIFGRKTPVELSYTQVEKQA